MSVMSIRHPEASEHLLTVDDLENTPDDGRRYELVDGRLDVSAAPSSEHFRIANRLSTCLNLLCEGEFEIGEGPGLNFQSEKASFRIPDVAVFDYEIPESKHFDIPPLLAVEIVSQDSTRRDYVTKRREYANFGIPSYWIIDPLLGTIDLTELRLEDGQYLDATQVSGEEVFETDFPFPIKLVPHWLLASGPWMKNLGGPTEES